MNLNEALGHSIAAQAGIHIIYGKRAVRDDVVLGRRSA